MTRDSLVSELGIAGLRPDMQDEVISIVGENIVKAVTLAAILKLPKGAQDEFKQLSEKNDAQGIMALLKQHIPDPDTFIEEEARKELSAFKASLAKKLSQ